MSILLRVYDFFLNIWLKQIEKMYEVISLSQVRCACLYVYRLTRRENRIGGVMVSVLASSTVDHGFEPQSGQTRDYKIDICCFSAKHAAIRKKSKDWLAQNQDNVSEWSHMSTRRLLF